MAIDSEDGTPPEYMRQVGAAVVGIGLGIPNRSTPLIKTVGVPYPRLKSSTGNEAKSIYLYLFSIPTFFKAETKFFSIVGE